MKKSCEKPSEGIEKSSGLPFPEHVKAKLNIWLV